MTEPSTAPAAPAATSRPAIGTGAVVGWTYAFMAGEVVQAGTSFAQAARGGGGDGFSSPLDVADSVSAMVSLVLYLVAGVLILRWIYRVNKRAHALSHADMKVSPGWNVGWFFVPIANLWKPFQGLRETYQASVEPLAPAGVPTPGALRGWWGVWIVYNLFSNLAFRVQSSGQEAAAQTLYGVGSLLALPLALLLIRVVRLITQAQRSHPDASVFS